MSSRVKNNAPVHAGTQPYMVVAVRDACNSEQRMAAIVARDKRYHIFGGSPLFYVALPESNKLPQSDGGIQ
jgi:hypothetical protein